MSIHTRTFADLLYYMDKVLEILFIYKGNEVRIVAKVVAVVSGSDYDELHLSLSEFDGRNILYIKVTDVSNSLELAPKSWDLDEKCSFTCIIPFSG